MADFSINYFHSCAHAVKLSMSFGKSLESLVENSFLSMAKRFALTDNEWHESYHSFAFMVTKMRRKMLEAIRRLRKA